MDALTAKELRDLGARIGRARALTPDDDARLGITQAKAAARAGVSDETWLTIENGKEGVLAMRERTLARIASAIGWDPDRLVAERDALLDRVIERAGEAAEVAIRPRARRRAAGE